MGSTYCESYGGLSVHIFGLSWFGQGMLSSLVSTLPSPHSVQADAVAAECDLVYLEQSELHKEAFELVLTLAREHKVQQINVLLGLLLFRAVKHDKTDEFYTTFETAVEVLPRIQLKELVNVLFDPSQPQFMDDLTKVSEGHLSIKFLRILNTLLHRFDSDQFSGERGLSLRVLAKVKGFGHPARLNKKGAEIKDTAFENELTLESPILGPDELMWYLEQPNADPAKIVNIMRSAGDKIVLNPTMMKTVAETCSTLDQKSVFHTTLNCDWSGVTWSRISVTDLYRLLAQLSFYARKPTPIKEAVEQSMSEMISRINGKVRSLQQRHSGAYNRFGVDRLLRLCEIQNRLEPLWEKWKELGCPKLDFPEAGIQLENYPDESSLSDAFAQLSGKAEESDEIISRPLGPMDDMLIGNEKVTNVMKMEVNFDSFKQLNTANKHDTNSFQRLRSQPWSNTIEQFNNQPVQINQRTVDLEQQMQVEEENEKKRKEAEAADRGRKRAMESDMGQKRQMLYSDDRRNRAAEATAKPLPY